MGLTIGARRTGALALMSLALVAAACAGSSPTPKPTPTPTIQPTSTATQAATSAPDVSEQPVGSIAVADAQVCADLATLQRSLDALTQVDIVATGTDGVKAAVNDVVTSGQALVASARAALGPSAQALATSLTDLQTSIAGLTADGPLADKAASIEDAIDGVATAFDDLKAQLAPGCPAS